MANNIAMEKIPHKFVYCDTELCIGCGMCMVKCSTGHFGITKKQAKELGIKLISRNWVIKIKEPKVRAMVACRHCEDSPCAKACPIGIIEVKNGMVRVNEEDCSGCGTCQMVCPYGAIEVHPVTDPETMITRNIALKCDLCYGEEKQACIASCKFKALSLMTWHEFEEKHKNM